MAHKFQNQMVFHLDIHSQRNAVMKKHFQILQHFPVEPGIVTFMFNRYEGSTELLNSDFPSFRSIANIENNYCW